MCILNQPRESLWTWPSSVVQLPSCSEALQQDKSPRDAGSMQRLACLKKTCVTLESLEMAPWPLNWKAQITGKCSGLPSAGSHRVEHDWSYLAAAADAIRKKPRRGLSFPRLLQQVPDPCLPHWVWEAAAAEPLLRERGVWSLIWGPDSNTCWLFDFRQATKLGRIPTLQLRLPRELIQFNYINTKYMFIRYVHEGCHEIIIIIDVKRIKTSKSLSKYKVLGVMVFPRTQYLGFSSIFRMEIPKSLFLELWWFHMTSYCPFVY